MRAAGQHLVIAWAKASVMAAREPPSWPSAVLGALPVQQDGMIVAIGLERTTRGTSRLVHSLPRPMNESPSSPLPVRLRGGLRRRYPTTRAGQEACLYPDRHRRDRAYHGTHLRGLLLQPTASDTQLSHRLCTVSERRIQVTAYRSSQ
jgi:hypothetical protein